MDELYKVLNEQSQFIKVHAAEYLIWLGHTEEVKKVYLKENDLYHEQTPYRIGIWRVLAQTEKDSVDKMKWIDKVFGVYGDPDAPDRLHATETLAKLQQSPMERYPGITRTTLSSDNRNLHTYALWALSYSSDTAMEKNRAEFLRLALEDTNQVIRKISAYILRKTGGLTEGQWNILAAKALTEPAGSGMKHSLLNTAFATLPAGVKQDTLFRKVHAEMVKNSEAFSAGERIELSLTLADKGDAGDISVLTPIFNNENSKGIYEPGSREEADVRATAAYAILKIKQRTEQQ